MTQWGGGGGGEASSDLLLIPETNRPAFDEETLAAESSYSHGHLQGSTTLKVIRAMHYS